MKQYYLYNEVCHLLGSPDFFIISCIKTTTLPNGIQAFQYQLKTLYNELYKDENGNSWIPQAQLRKDHMPSEYRFEGLMQILKDKVGGRDFL